MTSHDPYQPPIPDFRAPKTPEADPPFPDDMAAATGGTGAHDAAPEDTAPPDPTLPNPAEGVPGEPALDIEPAGEPPHPEDGQDPETGEADPPAPARSPSATQSPSSTQGGTAGSANGGHGSSGGRTHSASTTPFHDRMAGWALSWAMWNGTRVPALCSDPETEAMTLRLGCGLADLTPQSIVRLDGEAAADAVDRITTLTAASLADGMVRSTLLCNGQGRVIALADVLRLGRDSFLLVSETLILPWVEDAARGLAVRVHSELGGIAVLGLFGPRIFETLTRTGLMRDAQSVRGGMASIARHGLLGQLIVPDGPGGSFGLAPRAEIWVEPGDAGTLWDWILRDCGESVRPIGLDSLETARVTAGWPRIGKDAPSPEEAIDRRDALDPFDLGLEAMVDWEKPAFSGRGALVARHDQFAETGGRLFHVPLPGPAQAGQRVRRGQATARLTSLARCPVTGSWWGLARSDDPAPDRGGPWVLETLDTPPVRMARPGAILRA
ncbi:MAG: hypothetical protein ACFB6R_04285 [Alphaproteobacteria bacterium]